MINLIVLAYNIGYLRLMGVLNYLRGRCDISNGNGYSGPPYKKLSFSCIFFLLFLSVKNTPVNMNGTL